MKKHHTFLALLLCFTSNVFAQSMNIKLTVHGQENQLLILANYYGDKQYVKDTFKLDRNGTVNIKADEVMPGGVYLAVFPGLGNRYFEFIMGEKEFSIETDGDDLTGHIKINGSLENKLFYDDMSFLGTMRTKSNEVNTLYNSATNSGDKERYRAQLKQIDNEVKDRRGMVISQYPHLFYAKLLKAMKEIDVPEPPRNAYGAIIDSSFQWRYYKAHYWDNVDLSDERLLRSPVFHNKLKTFFAQTLVQTPDSLIDGTEQLLAKTDKRNEIYRYILTYILNEMANSKTMGFDAVYSHLGKNYFCKRYLTPWIEDDKREKICDRANKLAPVLVGQTAQKLILQNTTGEYQSLQGTDAKYTILSFWDVDCGHCKTEIPELASGFNQLKRDGVNVEGYSVMIGDRGARSEWLSLISSFGLNWINVADLDRESNFRSEWDIQSTPQIYILDRNKKIIARRIGAEQVADFIKNRENPAYKFKYNAQKTDDKEEGNVVISNTQIDRNQKPKQPPVLMVKKITFTDTDGNMVLNGNEKATIKFTLTNTGKGTAYSVKAKVTETTGRKGLFVDELQSVGSVEPGESKDIAVEVSGTKLLPTGKANFKVMVTEGNGFDSDPAEIEISTKEFLAPKVIVADYAFSTENGGPAKLGIPINLKIIVQNIGPGIANGVSVDFTVPEGIYVSDLTHYNIGQLQPGASKTIDYGFFGNKQYTQTHIPVTAKINESNGYGEGKRLEVELEQMLVSTEKVQITGNSTAVTAQIQLASLSSDVDKNIPVSNIPANEHRYALVIGNEDYTQYQTNLGGEVNVRFAANDARIFASYCEKTLGFPKQNIFLLEDAISSKMKQKIDELSKLIQYEEGNAEVIVYYAGHGFPDEATKESYLMPVDISGSNVTDGIKLSDLYRKLTQYPAKRVTVFLDACFSGGGRDAGLLAARGVKVPPKVNAVSGNILVLSASTGEQSALPYKEKQHGMFTYYLLKKLQDSKGDILYKDLFEYIKSNVQINSIKVNSKDQNPQAIFSPAVADDWLNWKVR